MPAAQCLGPLVSLLSCPGVTGVGVGVTEIIVQFSIAGMRLQERLQQLDGLVGISLFDQLIRLFEGGLQIRARWSVRPRGGMAGRSFSPLLFSAQGAPP